MNIFVWFIIIALFGIITVRPSLGIYLLAIFLPVIGWDFYFGNFILPLIDLLAIINLGAFLINHFYKKISSSEKEPALKWPLIIPFSLFFLASIISNILSIQPGNSFYYFLRWPFFLYFAYIFAPANIITNAKILKRSVILIFISTMAVLLSGYLSLINQDIQNAFFRLHSSRFFGLYPFGENHNLIAEFLNVGAFFILVIKEFIKEPRYRRLINAIFIITAIGILLTFSRAAWITLSLQCIIYLVYRLKNEVEAKRKAASLIFLALIAITPIFWKMNTLQDNNTGSTASRLLLSEISYKAWLEKPLFGHGSGEFINLVGADIRFTANHGEPMDSHGLIQKVLAENGLIGLIAWLGILFYLARFGFLAVKKYYPKVKWVLPFALAAGGGIFFQLFNTSYYKGRVWLPLILFVIAIEMSEKRQRLYVKKNKGLTSNS